MNTTTPLTAPKTVDKPWGREIWYAHTKDYAGKVLEVTAGKRLSLQKHEIKEETLYLLSGHVRLTFGEEQYDWHPGATRAYPYRHRASLRGHRRQRAARSEYARTSTTWCA